MSTANRGARTLACSVGSHADGNSKKKRSHESERGTLKGAPRERYEDAPLERASSDFVGNAVSETGCVEGRVLNHCARLSSVARRRLMIHRRLRRARGKHRASRQNAGSDFCSVSRQPPTTRRSRASIWRQNRRNTPPVIFLVRIKNRFLT